MTPRRAACLDATRGIEPSAGAIARAGREFGPELAQWAFTQWQLRARAAKKFALADQMLFTRAGLEMASHETVAALHASFFFGEQVIDLGCGIGADLVAFSKGSAAIGIDLDAEHVRCAAHNLSVHGLQASLAVIDALRTKPQSHACFIDPQRRTGDRRILDPARFSPRLDVLLPRLTESVKVLVRLTPMVEDDWLESLGGSHWFVSHLGECCECLALVAGESPYGTGGAILAESGDVIEPKPATGHSEHPMRNIFEVDPAAVRAGCQGRFGMPALGTSNVYLTSEVETCSPWLRRHLVLAHGPFHKARVSECLKQLGGRAEVVKTRGVPHEPEEVRRQFQPRGEKRLTLLLYPVASSVHFAICPV